MRLSLLVILGAFIVQSGQAITYTLVNESDYELKGKIIYKAKSAVACKTDNFTIKPKEKKDFSAGFCAIDKIKVTGGGMKGVRGIWAGGNAVFHIFPGHNAGKLAIVREGENDALDRFVKVKKSVEDKEYNAPDDQALPSNEPA